MENGLYLEVIACSVEDTIAAEEGGADRIELISHYEVGGLTPSLDLVEQVLARVRIPVRVMLRDEESFFVPEEKSREQLCQTARELAQFPIDGLVLGFLREEPINGATEIDFELLHRVLACAPGLRATFHRASEALPDPGRAIEALKPISQIDTLLTSGGPEPWPLKVGRLSDWVRRARPSQTILVGGGVYEEAISALRSSTPIQAYHIGQAVREGRRIDGRVNADRVREISALLTKSGSPKIVLADSVSIDGGA